MPTLTMKPDPSSLDDSCPLINLLKKSPWPLSIPDIAQTLGVDDMTATLALKMLREAGRARLEGCLWRIG